MQMFKRGIYFTKQKKKRKFHILLKKKKERKQFLVLGQGKRKEHKTAQKPKLNLPVQAGQLVECVPGSWRGEEGGRGGRASLLHTEQLLEASELPGADQHQQWLHEH